MEVWVSGRNQFTANADSPGLKGLNFSRVKLIILADIGVCAGVKILRMRLDSARFHFLYGVGSLVGSAPGYGSGIRGLYLISINLS